MTIKDSVTAVARMERGIRSAFNKVRDELDDHLDTINRNSMEIQGVYEFLTVLEQKIDKLADRIDDLRSEERGRPADSLTLREQEVFLVLYAADEPLSAMDIASQLGLDASRVSAIVTELALKGIPLIQQFFGGVIAYSLELRFKELQARQNIVIIDQQVSRSMSER